MEEQRHSDTEGRPDATGADGSGRAGDVPPAARALAAEGRSFLSSYWDKTKFILLRPREFFGSMPVTGGYGEPLVFLTVAAGVNGLMSGLMSFNLFTVVWMVPVTLVGVALAALVGNFLSQAMGGKGTYEATFRVFAYSDVTLLFAWVPVIGLFGVIYTFVLNFFGLKKVHELKDGQAIAVVLLSGILTAFILGLAACGVFLRSILKF